MAICMRQEGRGDKINIGESNGGGCLVSLTPVPEATQLSRPMETFLEEALSAAWQAVLGFYGC